MPSVVVNSVSNPTTMARRPVPIARRTEGKSPKAVAGPDRTPAMGPGAVPSSDAVARS